LIARFISGIKEFVPFIAGILKMPLKKFMIWNFLGAIGWAVFWISIGFVGGSFVKETEAVVKTVGMFFLAFFLISAFVYYQRNKHLLLENKGFED
jgi:undecaprenyl-diphosphatase